MTPPQHLAAAHDHVQQARDELHEHLGARFWLAEMDRRLERCLEDLTLHEQHAANAWARVEDK